MNLHQVLDYGPVVANDSDTSALVTANDVYLNLWIGRGDAFENLDCQHVGSRTGDQGLRELPLVDVIELAEAWLAELTGHEEAV